MANAAVDLITFATYCEIAGIDKLDNVRQGQVERLISAASRQFQLTADGRAFIQATDIQEFQGHGLLAHQVRYPPISSVVGDVPVIEYWNGTAWTTASVAEFPRQFDYVAGIVRMTESPFARGTRWRITYKGGWAVASIPEDIQLATFQLVQRALKRTGGKEGVKSEGRQQQNAAFDLADLMTGAIRSIAQGYKVIYIQ